MTTDQLRLRPPLRPFQAGAGLRYVLIGVPVAAGLGAAATLYPEAWRGLLALTLLANLVVAGMRWPRAAAVATLLWLPFLALVRRLLIEEAGWTQNDPLILVGPIAALFLCYRLFVVEKRELAGDRLSKLVLFLLVVAVISIVNPFSTAGVVGNVAGFIYVGVPLLWFFIGREVADRVTIRRLMYAVIVLGCAIGAYGLYQTEYGSLPQWDLDWYYTAGFAGVRAATSEAGHLLFRPWGTFSSTSEYSAYLAIALFFAVAFVLHRRPAAAIAVPLLVLAVFLAGGRSVMALALLTGVVLLGLRTRNRVAALVVVILGIGFTYGVALTLGQRLDRAAGVSGSATAERQVGGLVNPLDPNKSTFLSHWSNFTGAVEDGFKNPVGLGTGATNIGGRVEAGGGDRETDIDVGDAFVNFGFVGGFAFLAIIVVAFRRVIRRYLRGPPDPLVFAAIGIMIVNLEQWLQGGHYAASPLMWFVVGWAAKPPPEAEGAAAERAEQGGQSRWERWAPWRRRKRAAVPAGT